MSEFHVEVVRLGEIRKHENADTLGITKVRDYPVIVRLGELNPGDLAVYVPVDSVVPGDDPRWEFLKGHNRIKAKRLRGIFSMGLLTKADPSMTEGQEVTEVMRIKKYEPPENAVTGGDNERCTFEFPKYTDLDAFRRWPDILTHGEQVVATEKIHGTNGRFVFSAGRLWCGSHTQVKKESPDVVWWKVAKQYNLAEKLAAHPDIALYGEVYGYVQDLRYGHASGRVSLRVFDAMNLVTMRYLDYKDFTAFADLLSIPRVPELYVGPFTRDVLAFAEGKTMIPQADHVREGIVIRPVVERFDERIQRVILKYHGEGYLTR